MISKITTPLIIFIILVAWSCNDNIDKKEQNPISAPSHPCPPIINIDSIRYAIRTQIQDEISRDLFISAGEGPNQYTNGGIFKTNFTFPSKSLVFAIPDTNSEVVAELPFCSKVYPVEGLKRRPIQGAMWMKITHPSDPKKFGYIRDKDLADYMERVYNKNYGFLIGEVDTIIDGYWQQGVEIRRFRENSHVILEKYKTKGKESGYRFKRVFESTLKGSNSFESDQYGPMFIYDTFRQSCPGGGLTEFIIDDGSKLLNITSVSTEGEGGYFNLESAYIPIKFDNGKVLLVENADMENIFNRQTADLNTFPYNSKYNVPIENMVVIKYESNGYDNADMDIDPETVKVITRNTIYKWDGKKLIKIQEE